LSEQLSLRKQTANTGEDTGKRTLIDCWWESFGRYLQKLKLEHIYDPGFHFWVYTQKDKIQVTTEIPSYPCLLWHYS
jgi:hypothetical protein